jgi:hypothetical protein
MSAPDGTPAFDPTTLLSGPLSPMSSCDEYTAGMDGLSFGWLYARFLQYLQDSNLSHGSKLAKRFEFDNSTDYLFVDNTKFNSTMNVKDPFFMNLTLPMAMQFLGLGAHGGFNVSDLVDGPPPEPFLPPIPELFYCGVKWKGEGVKWKGEGVNGFLPIEDPALLSGWLRDMRGLLIALVVLVAILLLTACVGICLQVFRRR